jgi:hypothetical protein
VRTGQLDLEIGGLEQMDAGPGVVTEAIGIDAGLVLARELRRYRLRLRRR